VDRAAKSKAALLQEVAQLDKDYKHALAQVCHPDSLLFGTWKDVLPTHRRVVSLSSHAPAGYPAFL
jgi:hypothetical protein